MRALNPISAGKLFVTGFTVGPIVDSLHNQCLLKYDILPISIAWPQQMENIIPPPLVVSVQQYPYLFCSSWTVPPSLGIAYVVLGGLLPRIFEALLVGIDPESSPDNKRKQGENDKVDVEKLKNRALLAVTTTALIIKLSEYLVKHPTATLGGESTGVGLLLMAALTQWAILDGTIVALLAATVTSIGGPLSELPFVAHGVWEYFDSAADYLPLQNLPPGNQILEVVLNQDYPNLALSHITGPCYFAVAMDAIALGRWFDAAELDVDIQTVEERS
jgi:hypothetical protein